MVLDEIFCEHEVSMEKTVWTKEGNNISRKKVRRVVGTNIYPRSNIQIKDSNNES